jgi:hypothetical protein
VLQVIINHIGVGWCFTLFAAIAATTIPLLLAERKWGMKWRSIGDRKRRPENKTLPQEVEGGINARKNDLTHGDVAAGDTQEKNVLP